jgi:uncharacterized protein
MLGAIIAKTLWWKLVLYGAAAYLSICILVYFGQRKLLYVPSKYENPLPVGFEQWRAADDSELWGYKRLAGARECLFFFHGNGGNASGWSHAAAEFPGDVFVLEYPGYGQRGGSPSERSLKEAALKGFEAEQQRYDKIILAGQSLGTAVTQVIFSRHPDRISKLVLITPFTSIADVAQSHFPFLPARWMVRDTLRLFDEWRKFRGKTCIVLAGRDEIIPRSHSRRYLEARSESCEIVELPNDSHNSIDLSAAFWKKVLAP